MLKILTGEYKYKTIKVVTKNKEGTRPTSTKVREAIFNTLGQYFKGGIFLELFGGSGIMTLEAISRGMTKGIYIEKKYYIYDNFKKNVELLSLNNKIEYLFMDAFHYIDKVFDADYIFIDAPYKQKKLNTILKLICNNLNKDNCKIIIEISNKVYTSEDLKFLKNYNIIYNRDFGISKTLIIEL